MSVDLKDFGRVLLNPVSFATGILQHDVYEIPKQILNSIATHPRTAVKACHSSSKSFTAAEAVLWWITRFPDGVAITTAPVWKQVERVMWVEIHKAAEGALIKYPPLLNTELRLKKDNFAIGISTDKGVNFQGYHGRILIVLDEAVGINPDIWEAIEGIRAGGNVHTLALGNPTVAGGPFYDAFGTQRQFWNTFTINAFATPNFYDLMPKHLHGVARDLTDEEVQIGLDKLLSLSDKELDRNPRPYLTKRRWVKEKFFEWGIGHPLWDSRVLGRFPLQSEHSLFHLTWLDQAKVRKFPKHEYHELPYHAGLDVAGPGDDETVLVIRQGPMVVFQKFYTSVDPRGEILADLLPYRDKLEACNVDTIGIGYYMARHLADNGIQVVDVNVQATPTPLNPLNKEKYKDLRAEIYWTMHEHFEKGSIAGVTDELMLSQLAGIQYSHDTRGRIEVESKDKMRERGMKSPDRAEGLILAFANIPKAKFFISRL